MRCGCGARPSPTTPRDGRARRGSPPSTSSRLSSPTFRWPKTSPSGWSREGRGGACAGRSGERRARELLASVGARLEPQREAGTLSMPEQQLVEIARAVGASSRVLILDEPTASLSEDDTRNLFGVIQGLRAQGVGMIYISHRLEELPKIADRVTVLRDGQTIATREAAGIGRDELIALMVGRDWRPSSPSGRSTPGRGGPGAARARLPRRRGERREPGDSSRGDPRPGRPRGRGTDRAGADPLRPRPRRTRARCGCAAVPFGSPLRPRRSRPGIAYVPEDRRRHGVILEMPIDANITPGLARPAVARMGPRPEARAGARPRLRAAPSASRPHRPTRRWQPSPAATSRRWP